MSAVLAQPTEGHDVVLARRAQLFLWISLAFAVLAFGVGTRWDSAWHGTHPFEEFWSPPHLFIYSMTALSTLAFARVLLDRSLREQFGAGVRLPVIPFAIPPSLLFATGGFASLWLAGTLDNIWHSTFGLDETDWSFPHATLRWGILTILAGLFACQFALADRVRWYTRWLFSWVLLGMFENLATGAFGSYTIPAIERKISALPVLAIPPTQHLFRIDLAWNLNHTNPLYLVFAALGVGMGLALVREINRSDWLVVAMALVTTIVSSSEEHTLAQRLGVTDPSAWLPTPMIVPAVVFLVFLRFGLDQKLAGTIAGAAFGVVVCLFWHIGAIWIIPGALAMPVGMAIGREIAKVIARPTGPTVLRFIAIANLAIPVAGGCVDLFLRWSTP